jgi:hypothetical protein
VFGVRDVEMSYPGSSAIYRHCAMCGAPFRVWPYALRAGNRGKFCTFECYVESHRALSKALSDGRLDAILAPEREAARRKRAARKVDEFMARKLADRA